MLIQDADPLIFDSANTGKRDSILIDAPSSRGSSFYTCSG